MLSLVLIKTGNVPLPIPTHKNPPNRILNRFFELNSAENKMQLESESSSRKKSPTGNDRLNPSRIFPNFFNHGLRGVMIEEITIYFIASIFCNVRQTANCVREEKLFFRLREECKS